MAARPVLQVSRPAPKPKCGVFKLPDDVLSIIFGHLHQRDYLNMRCVNRAMQQLVQINVQQLCFRNSQRRAVVSSCIASFSRLNSLSVQHMPLGDLDIRDMCKKPQKKISALSRVRAAPPVTLGDASAANHESERVASVHWVVSAQDPVAPPSVLVDEAALQRVTQLQLKHCPTLTNNALLHISRCCSQLRDLDLSQCVGLSDPGLLHLSKGCQWLHSVNLSGCTKVTSTGVMYLLRSCEQLQRLALGHCTQVNDGFMMVAAALGQLRLLDIQYCTRITEDAVLALMRGCTQLHTLCVIGCNLVQPAVTFASALPALTRLHIDLDRVRLRQMRKVWTAGQGRELLTAEVSAPGEAGLLL